MVPPLRSRGYLATFGYTVTLRPVGGLRLRWKVVFYRTLYYRVLCIRRLRSEFGRLRSVTVTFDCDLRWTTISLRWGTDRWYPVITPFYVGYSASRARLVYGYLRCVGCLLLIAYGPIREIRDSRLIALGTLILVRCLIPDLRAHCPRSG